MLHYCPHKGATVSHEGGRVVAGHEGPRCADCAAPCPHAGPVRPASGPVRPGPDPRRRHAGPDRRHRPPQ